MVLYTASSVRVGRKALPSKVEPTPDPRDLCRNIAKKRVCLPDGTILKARGSYGYLPKVRAERMDQRDSCFNIAPPRHYVSIDTARALSLDTKVTDTPPMRLGWEHEGDCDCVNCDALLRGRMP